ncbi:MAG TPA: HAMP domain-containing sensor histidine kinase [Pseudonocardia sp.]|nr:HAMP domain-containing sensor histidine kinase [Pseudonocardia sp.]
MSEPAGERFRGTDPGTDVRPRGADPGTDVRLRTVSLRRRVVLYSLAVLGVILVAVSVLAEVFVGIGSRADLNSRLADRAALAEQLAERGTPPEDIIDQLASPSIRTRLVTPSGAIYGSRFLSDDEGDRAGASGQGRPGANGQPRSGPGGQFGPGGQAGPASPGPRAARRGPPTGPVRRLTLPDGSRLTLVGDAADIAGAQRRLGRLLLYLAAAGLVVAVVALLITTSVALRPLDAMTGLARQIAGGDRGRRLAPTRTDTEMGRTAAAFDDMLDALEGAETAARESEARTRQFVADAAHELRTPIAGVRAAAEAGLSMRADGEERDRLQLLLIREAARAGRLVDDLLAMARIDAGLALERGPVELLGLARAEAERTRLLAPTLRVAVTGEPATVLGDAGRLSQILVNLLDNARRHTPPDGEISIGVDRPSPGWARIRVADSGAGVPDQDRERIFDRLVRLDDARARDGGSGAGAGAGAGAGLGLAIARGIARAHGGDLRCAEGSVFELTLPTG